METGLLESDEIETGLLEWKLVCWIVMKWKLVCWKLDVLLEVMLVLYESLCLILFVCMCTCVLYVSFQTLASFDVVSFATICL